MFGNMGFKLGFGALNDYIGAKRTTILSYVLLAVASYVLIVGSQILVCFASFLFGINALIATTQTPLLARDVYSRSEYPVALQVAQISVRLSYALFAVVEGALFDMWGEFRPLLVLQVVVCAIGLAFVFLLYSRRIRKA
jgi:MFS family permease